MVHCRQFDLDEKCLTELVYTECQFRRETDLFTRTRGKLAVFFPPSVMRLSTMP